MKLQTLSPDHLTSLFLALAILLLSAFVFGKIFEALKTPKVIGEILGGFVLGSSGFYFIAPDFIGSIFNAFNEESKILNVFYQLGLIFLMFMAGFNTQISFAKQNLKIITALFVGATFIPAFLGFFFIDYFHDIYIGQKGNYLSFSLVFLIAIAVTSIPVISKIFFDIGVIKTRFASVVLTTSTIQDLFLWILLNVAINATTSTSISLYDNLLTAFITIVLFICVKLFANLVNKIRFNLNSIDFLTLAFVLLFLAIAFLNTLHINPMYSAFLIGFLIKNILTNYESLKEKVSAVNEFSFSYFIPIYFALIGIQLDIIHEFSFVPFVCFCVLACVFEFFGAFSALLCLKMSNLARINFAITMNARGGPGIVLASVAFYYQIINVNFFTTLILTTLLSSMLAGYWLRFVKNKNNKSFENFED
ncbi:cation:proton antiporter [Campylobacter sp. MIT 99-7217]|uniref:cation:proton antiporter n=1 Tax=Campylobacter sp. MIT 99-7217 TaxID=535091 RepID=UPI001157EDDD|nr:cation:proton antiporter [Campylobacter sp. MIT 99-7217]TQR32964.1 cation:proton antiporter [Campylobacter sp. MIT 99-7217]